MPHFGVFESTESNDLALVVPTKLSDVILHNHHTFKATNPKKRITSIFSADS